VCCSCGAAKTDCGCLALAELDASDGDKGDENGVTPQDWTGGEPDVAVVAGVSGEVGPERGAGVLGIPPRDRLRSGMGGGAS